MEYLYTCVKCNIRIKSSKLLLVAVMCFLTSITVSQKVPSAPHIITDAPIIVKAQVNAVTPSDQSPPTNNTALVAGESEGGEAGEEAGEGADGAEAGEGVEGAPGEGGAQGGEGGGMGATGGEGAEREEAEGTEGPESEQEALEEKLEDLVEQYRARGLSASIDALHTMYPGINMTHLLIDMEREDAMEAEGLEHEGPENEIEGSEGRVAITDKYGGKYDPLHTPVPDKYGDYEVDYIGQPKDKYQYLPSKPNTEMPKLIQPTGVNQAIVTGNTEGVQARLVDPKAKSNSAGWSAGQAFSQPRPKHPNGMTASATVGVLFGTLLLSWLVLGPALCLAWRWNERRREKKKMLFRRPELHGSMDEGIMEAMVKSELGKSHRKGGERGGRRVSAEQQKGGEDIEMRLTWNRSELQSFPTTTTMESMLDEVEVKESKLI